MWPGNLLHLTQFGALQDLYRQREKSDVAVIVLAFAMMHGMLRRCAEDTLRKHGANRWAAEQTVDRLRGASATMTLLTDLLGEKSLVAFFRGGPLEKFARSWERVREIRNQVAHGTEAFVDA